MQTRTISDLIVLIKSDNIEEAKKFILEEKNIDYKNNENGSSLIHAVQRQQKEIVELLLEKGCDVFFQNDKGNTALHAAVKFDGKLFESGKHGEFELKFPNTEILLLILKYLDKNLLANAITHNEYFLFNRKGESPLHIAASRHNQEAVQALVDNGFSINCQNTIDDTTPLVSALIPMFKRNNYTSLETIKLLLKLGADLYNLDEENKHPIHYAISYNLIDVIILFLEAGLNTSIYSEQKLLHFAAEASLGSFDNWWLLPKWNYLKDLEIENKTVIDLLVKKFGQDVNQLNKKGSTPLHSAARDKNSFACERLILNGAQFQANSNGETPLHMAVKHSNDPNDRVGTHDMQIIQTIETLLTCKGCDINQENQDGKTATDVAVKRGLIRGVEFLLSKSGNLQKDSREKLLDEAKKIQAEKNITWNQEIREKIKENTYHTHLNASSFFGPQTIPQNSYVPPTYVSPLEIFRNQAQQSMLAEPQVFNNGSIPFYQGNPMLLFPQSTSPVPLLPQGQEQHTMEKHPEDNPVFYHQHNK